jgi:hypothetical protein
MLNAIALCPKPYGHDRASRMAHAHVRGFFFSFLLST